MPAPSTPISLTENQLLLWAGQRLWPNVPLYNVAFAFTILGPLDQAAFRAAFGRLIWQTDALMTLVDELDGTPRQILANAPPADLGIRDVSKAADPLLAATRWMQKRTAVPLNLRKCAYESTLLKLAGDTHIWYLNHHHMVTDGYSVGVLYRRMVECYQMVLSSSPEGESPRPSFRDFVLSANGYTRTAGYLAARSYWDQKLARSPEPIHFYGDSFRQRDSASHRLSVSLGRERTAALKSIAGRFPFLRGNLNISLFTIFATLVLAYLYKINGREDLTLGCPFHNRGTSADPDLAGLVMQIAVLRVRIEGGDTFLSLWRKVFADALESSRHSRFTIRNPHQKPHYDTVFNFLMVLFPDFAGALCDVDWIHPGHQEDKFVLTARDFGPAGDITLDFDFRRDILDERQSSRAADHFLRILDSFIEDQHNCIDTLDLLCDEERDELLVELNRTEVEYPRGLLLHQLFEKQVQRKPDAIAVVFRDRQLTYRELNEHSNRLARALLERGVGPEVLVGICFRSSIESIVAILAVLKAGGAYVPLDPASPPDRLSAILGETQLRIVLTLEKWSGVLPQSGLTVLRLDSEGDDLASLFGGEVECRAALEDLAYVMYTSGTTGMPKGVMVTHAGLCNRFLWEQETYRRRVDDRVLQQMSLNFDYSVLEIFMALIAGARLVIAEKDRCLDKGYLVNLIRDQRITIANFVPSQLRIFLADPLIHKCVSLRQVFSSAEVLDVALQEMFFRKLRADLYNTYGPTEATIDVTHWKCRKDDPSPVVPIGRPVGNAKLYVLDARQRPVPRGLTGELYIGGVPVARGYYRQPGLTAERFIPDPFSSRPGSRLYRTGDLVRYLPDGNLEFIGRADSQVKVRGYRIEPGEIVLALKRIESIADATVTAVEDASGSKRIVAYVVPHGGGPLPVPDVRRRLKDTLPEYMLPSQFILLESIPLTANGKVDRDVLPAPGRVQPGSDRAPVQPRTEVEIRLARIWKDVLNLESIGVDDDFFDLGGDSLQGINLLLEVEKEFGKDLPLSALYHHNTVERLAGLLQTGAITKTGRSLVPLRSSGHRPPLFIAPGIGGGLLYLRHLVSLLREDRPVIGLLNEHPDPRSGAASIEEIAADYLQQILAFQPTGPYYLAGHSFGGYIALEIARQLRRRGEAAVFLAILDSFPPGEQRPARWPDRIALHLDNLRNLTTLRGYYSYFMDRLNGVFLHLYRIRPVRRFVGILRITPRDQIVARVMAFSRYDPEPYPGDVILLKANQRPAFMTWDPMANWKNYLSGGLEVHEIPGDHGNLIKEPYVHALAEKLKACLDRFDQS